MTRLILLACVVVLVAPSCLCSDLDPPAPKRPVDGVMGDPNDDFEDDVSVLIARFGNPDKDDNTAYDKPRPPIVTRWLVYKAEHVRANYIVKGGTIEDEPPYDAWKLIGFTDPRNNHVVSTNDAIARLSGRKPGQTAPPKSARRKAAK